jgi:hypothetical protein
MANATLTPTKTTVGERIYLARTRSGNHNAKAFYDELGLNRDRLRKVERGDEEARLSDLTTIGWATGHSVDWLRYGDQWGNAEGGREDRRGTVDLRDSPSTCIASVITFPQVDRRPADTRLLDRLDDVHHSRLTGT